MKKMTCIAIDDEPLALALVARFCERYGGLELKTYSEPQVGFEAILRMQPDIVFLDIEMTDMNGLQIARRLPQTSCLIFTTAYAQYALEGFDLDAVDYLRKPFAYERFEKAVGRARQRVEFLRARTGVQEETLILREAYERVPIPLSDILYIEAMNGYVKIFRESGLRTVSRITLKKVIEMLPEKEFLRIHRSYVVARSKITGFTRRRVILTDKKELPVGRQYAAQLNLGHPGEPGRPPHRGGTPV